MRPSRCRRAPCGPGDRVTQGRLSATVTQDPAHPLGLLVGDLLVRVPSGSGPDLMESTFPIETSTYGGLLHHELQNPPQVHDQIRACRTR